MPEREKTRVKAREGRTKQEFVRISDVGNIVKKYQLSGTLDHVARTQAFCADVSQFGDFHEVMTKVARANQAFLRFPARIRSRFDNQPAKMLAFLRDPKNRDEAVKLGLMKPEEKKVETAVKVEPKAPEEPAAVKPGQGAK